MNAFDARDALACECLLVDMLDANAEVLDVIQFERVADTSIRLWLSHVVAQFRHLKSRVRSNDSPVPAGGVAKEGAEGWRKTTGTAPTRSWMYVGTPRIAAKKASDK